MFQSDSSCPHFQEAQRTALKKPTMPHVSNLTTYVSLPVIFSTLVRDSCYRVEPVQKEHSHACRGRRRGVKSGLNITFSQTLSKTKNKHQKPRTLERKKLWLVVTNLTPYPEFSKLPGHCQVGIRLINYRSRSQQLHQYFVAEKGESTNS